MYNSVTLSEEIARTFTVGRKVPCEKQGQHETALNIIIKP
jgi:hypothetical protein